MIVLYVVYDRQALDDVMSKGTYEKYEKWIEKHGKYDFVRYYLTRDKGQFSTPPTTLFSCLK